VSLREGKKSKNIAWEEPCISKRRNTDHVVPYLNFVEGGTGGEKGSLSVAGAHTEIPYHLVVVKSAMWTGPKSKLKFQFGE